MDSAILPSLINLNSALPFLLPFLLTSLLPSSLSAGLFLLPSPLDFYLYQAAILIFSDHLPLLLTAYEFGNFIPIQNMEIKNNKKKVSVSLPSLAANKCGISVATFDNNWRLMGWYTAANWSSFCWKKNPYQNILNFKINTSDKAYLRPKLFL